MRRTENSLEIIDVRAETLNKSNWMVTGTIYKNDDDDLGADVLEGFDDIKTALAFIEKILSI